VTVGECVDAYFARLGPLVTAEDLVPLFAVLGWDWRSLGPDKEMFTAEEIARWLEEDRP
jgi:hypothetical protein